MIWEKERLIKAYIIFSADNVKRALNEANQTIHKFYPNHVVSKLIADGGGENNNNTIDDLLRKVKNPSITKVIALKDISFSNSSVEAINKIMKRYLYHYNPTSMRQLNKILNETINDYNNVRPHGSLKGKTPMECYTKATINMDFSSEKTEARTLRVTENRKIRCSECQWS